MSKNYPFKRPLDFCLALIGIFLSLPLWILIGLLIWLEDGRPIFYIQGRVGLNGKVFKMAKFRTMGYKREESSLSAFLRKTALDELPQLINILKAEMSFVGPRPLIPEEVNSANQAEHRVVVRPGLTGIAQLIVSKNAPILEKSRYDLWYIDNQGLGLDMIIILRSFWISLRRKWDSLRAPIK